MALLVFVTDRCEEDAKNHGYLADVEALKKQVEQKQSTSSFDQFPAPYLVKKKLGGRQGRLIADVRSVGEHSVVVCLAILIRGHRAYEDGFAVDPIGYGQKHFANSVSKEALVAFVDERTRTTPPPLHDPPSDIEFGWLYGAFAHHRSATAPDDLVCETPRWVEEVGQERIAKQLALLCDPCLRILGKQPGLHFEPVPQKAGWGVWALRTEGRLLLITPATDQTIAQAEAFARETAETLLSAAADVVLRASRRAYPAFILADDELWIDLEKETEANMALSPEESSVLESARHSDNPFPLFINGRAGSGKSTILQYLFADLLFHFLETPENSQVAPPIYLTANKELLRVARRFVERLLRTDPALMATSGQASGHREALLEQTFREFYPFLLSLVPAGARSQFAVSARVDYPRFRRMWRERFGKDPRATREFGPDLSWHVIRSYVKSMSSETLLDPDDYAQLPQNQITVTQAAFELVHERVWEGWYQPELESRGLWDDQDLARHVLEEELAKPVYPAVFCDEAQDFTRLELELLLRLNLFSHREVPPMDIRRVPFAFAGDQFQTLNPTGFRWDSIKASFVEKFIFELDPARRSGKVELNYRELEFNYRSTPQIVRFGNHVQATRAVLFGSEGLRPQVPWSTGRQSFPVVYFRANDAAFWRKVRENPGFVVLIPCNEGEEAEFVQQDSILREHIRIEDGVPVNVLSAARAKGCEYPAVIVYGFGSSEKTDVVSAIEEGETEAFQDPDKALPLQYFVNRLYVAVSRPKQRLVVVDSDEGFARLWKFAQDESSESVLLGSIRGGADAWGSHIQGMQLGNVDDLTRESAGDPLENARTFELDGLARRDAFLMRQAAQAFRSAGDSAKASECRARALEYDSEFLQAGAAFFDAGFALPDGVRCFWLAGRDGWTSLNDRGRTDPTVRRETEFVWSEAIVAGGCRSAIDALERFASRLAESEFVDRCAGEAMWVNAIGALLQPFVDPKQSEQTSDVEWSRLIGLLDVVRKSGVSLPTDPCALIYFRAKRYREAIELWERKVTSRPREYDRAKVSIEPFPSNILSLAKLKLFGEIVEAYDAQPGVSLTSEQADALLEALGEQQRENEALRVAWQKGTPGAIARMVSVAVRAGRTAWAKQAMRVGLHVLVREGRWEDIALFASSGSLRLSDPATNELHRGLVDSELTSLRRSLVLEIARAERTEALSGKGQKRLVEFLRREGRGKGGQVPAGLSVEEVGSAFERIGIFKDALEYYESIEAGKGSSDQKRFARQRWVVCKRRQIERERSHGNRSKADEFLQDLQSNLVRWQIKAAAEFAPYPELLLLDPVTVEEPSAVKEDPTRGTGASATEPVAKRDESLTVTIGALKCEMSRKIGRCNLSHAETMATAFVKFDERSCGGEAGFVELADGQWRSEVWGVVIQLLGAEERTLALVFDGGVTVSVQL